MKGTLIAFRTDATAKVALGHLRRCIALAHALHYEGAIPWFLCFDDPAARATLEGTGFPCQWLSHEINAGTDAAETVDRLRQLRPVLVFVDSYFADVAYFSVLRDAGFTIGIFDDFCQSDYPVSCVINGLPGAEKLAYHAPTALVGPQYLVLGPEYWNAKLTTPKASVKSILITMGGIDHYDLSSRVIRLLNQIARGMSVHVIIGPYYENQASINTAIGETKNRVVVHQSLSTLRPLMSRSDMAISAGGFTLYELAAMGVPTIGIALWRNQLSNVNGLGSHEAIIPLCYEDSPQFDKQLATTVRSIAENFDQRCHLAQAGQRLIDGQGARRAARAILASIKQPATNPLIWKGT